ncbi:hypothetical protein FRC98_17900 [Lujinxingia vulgaris]|uniref:Glycerophosphoryl diester phosphodiesterase membrane domain-containing protein n=1 Tax=Lujinxingia vulgaris TaxID=2600176 RepID=A0A5C6XD28_9DELT|nr:hypothetical protein [Lujinxingia vulgaris]TXD34992.1 hypothetical protein FRC98_17900 [Lujinxingia vulgaris]
MMNLSGWFREFFHVWRLSQRQVVLHMLPLFAALGLWAGVFSLYPITAIYAAIPLMMGLVVGWVHLHRVGYEAVHAEEGVHLPMKSWFVRAMRGVVVLFGFNLIGLVFFFVPSIAAQILLMPFLIFIMVEGEEPVEALKTNVRLAGSRLGGVVVFWLASVVGAWVLFMLGWLAPVAAYLTYLDVNGPGYELLNSTWVMWAVIAFGFIVAMSINYSIKVAAAITTYRVLRGQTVDTSECSVAGAGAASSEVDSVVW